MSKLNLLFRNDRTSTNICFVNKFDWLGAAPMGIVSVMMCHALASTGNKVTLYISGTHDPTPNKTLLNKYGLEPVEGLKLQVLPKSFIKNGSKFALFLYIRATFHIFKNNNRNEKLIIISRNTNFLPFLWLLKKLTGASSFFESHSFHNRAKGERKWMGLVPSFHTIQPWFLEKVFVPRIDGIICLTRSQSRLYKAIMPLIPSVVLPLGSPKPTQNSGRAIKTRDPRKLVYCGRFVDTIDVTTLLEALQLCKNIGTTLTWFGLSETEKKTLLILADQHGVKDSVITENWITHQELQDKISNEFGIGLAIYKKNFITSMLTSPTKIFDYYAAGLPVIASNINSIKDIMIHENQGLLYAAGDKYSLYQCIYRIVNDPEMYCKLQKNSLQSAEFFSWENRAERFIAFAKGRHAV